MSGVCLRMATQTSQNLTLEAGAMNVGYGGAQWSIKTACTTVYLTTPELKNLRELIDMALRVQEFGGVS